MPVKTRNPSLDLIRVIATFSVLSVHFFLNTQFYETTVAGPRMFVMVLARTFFMVCVPLFLLLTGYLCGRKTLSLNYYRGIRRTLETYLVVSILCLALRRLLLHETIFLPFAIISIFNFSASSYAWYVEMYIGLFLLIPFLNLLYNGLGTKRKKQLLILTAALLCSAPTLLNLYIKILPDWWTNLYPVLYYFIGVYIREYDIPLPRRINVLLLGICCLLFGSFNYVVNYGDFFRWRDYVDWNGFQNVIDSVLLFLLLLHLPAEKAPQPCIATLTKVSTLSLGLYLSSSVTDQLIYPRLNAAVASMPMRMNYFLPASFCSFLAALILSQIASWLMLPLDATAARISVLVKKHAAK